MKRFVEGVDRGQSRLFPERLEDWIGEDNPVRVIDVFVDELDLGGLGFDRVEPRETGRPGYHPAVLLKLYIYGYLNRVQSSRRLERDLCGGERGNPPPTATIGELHFYMDGSGSAQPFSWATASSRALIASALPFLVSLSRSIFSAKPAWSRRIILPCSAKSS